MAAAATSSRSVLDLQPLAQMTDDARIEESFSGRVEPGLVAECAHQDLESLTEGVVAEVVEARTPSGGREQVGWHGHRAVRDPSGRDGDSTLLLIGRPVNPSECGSYVG